MYWLDLEFWQDAMAGPISSIITSGGCDYEYRRDDPYFADVNEPETLHAQLRHWHAKLVEGIESFAPRSREEFADLASMRMFALAISAVAEEAWQIERDRWEAAGIQP